ncbi:potassium/proton antiporter [Burkholderiaceae bacterium FT117]|uniref:potassium/proton antiporter n=1 Tax=Zeimonas sediminis TaxID=2944268 RepID=UPI002342E442|nr:potassium/proton antiporter [Zeimonas sediminis]MCM5570580.1 potassium/proton antiporter [Zeimonas sediminis]
MDIVNQVLLAGALVMFAGILLGAVSSRQGIPFLVVFLVVGMLAGEDGIGGIRFADYGTTFFVGNLALAVILLDGGLRTKFSTFRVALRPSLVLASAGVLLTAVPVGLFAAWALGVDWRLGLLLGSIVGSTDAAAVFALLRASGTRLNERVANTLEIESGVNDPMAIFLTTMMIQVLMAPDTFGVGQLLAQLAMQFGLGVVLGLALGRAMAWIMKRAQVGEGLSALLLCSGGVVAFALVNSVGGSGFIAVYLVGLVVGNRMRRTGENLLKAMDGMAWLAQSSMFLLMGLLVTPSEMPAILGAALLVSLFLMFVARPLSVWLCLWPFHFAPREVGFMGWMGLRGAVPIVLAMFPLLAGVPDAKLLFNVAFVVVLSSLLLQGASVPFAARRFGVGLPPRDEPRVRPTLSNDQLAVLEFPVGERSSLSGVELGSLIFPPGVRVVGVLRESELMAGAEAGPLQANDVVMIIAPDSEVDHLSEMFTRVETSVRRAAWGDFVLDGSAGLADVCSAYGCEAPADYASLSLDETMRQLQPRLVEGDEVRVAGLALVAREIADGRVVKAGLKLVR